MEYSEIITKRICQLCDKKGITINRLAAMAGLRQSSVNNIIHGTSKNPGIKTLHKIAVAFGMTVSEFLDFPELNEYDIEEID